MVGAPCSGHYAADLWLQSVADVHAKHMAEAGRAACEAEAALRAAHAPLAAALDHQADQLQQFVVRQQQEATAAVTETEALLEEGTRCCGLCWREVPYEPAQLPELSCRVQVAASEVVLLPSIKIAGRGGK